MMKLRSENGRFTTDELENLEINNMLKALCGQQPTEPAPTAPANGAGQPVPPRTSSLLVEDEGVVMNRALRALAGVADPDSR